MAYQAANNRFLDLSYQDFRQLAQDGNLSLYEKIGFPKSYREGKEALIWQDILGKIPGLAQGRQKTIVDIGPGCSELPTFLIEHCERQGHTLILVDSPEMLDLLPDKPFIRKIAGFFPDEIDLSSLQGQVDTILCYSVLHYLFKETNLWRFFDAALSLLNHGGEMLLGDIPNASMRRRFFESPAGVAFHQRFMQTTDAPTLHYNVLEPDTIDDSVVFSLMMRGRNQGFDTYVLPQATELPLANRREDILIRKP